MSAPDMRKEAKEYDKYAVSFYKENLLADHIPIEILSLCLHFFNLNVENKIVAVIIGRHH